MSRQYVAVAEALMDIEYELRQLRLWQDELPPPEALASNQPFAVDTLELHQWLQFIFLPKMNVIVERRDELPSNCAIAPMAEEFYKEVDYGVGSLIAQLRRLDGLIGS